MVKFVVWDHVSEVRFFHPRPNNGGSTGVRRSLARIVSSRVRYPRPPPYKNTSVPKRFVRLTGGVCDLGVFLYGDVAQLVE